VGNKKKSFEEICGYYFKRYGYDYSSISVDPNPETKIIITIPVFNEPHITLVLNSINKCDRSTCNVEVIALINSGYKNNELTQEQNKKTYQECLSWIDSNKSEGIDFHFMLLDKLPEKHAGVGMARKIAMDEALRRFQEINTDGAIVCLDADCTVDVNYLQCLEKEFLNTDGKAGVVQYNHKLDGVNNELLDGIIQYELGLRYYSQGLKFAHYPYHWHTIGSCMIVRASTYALAGGMNKRKAGEDFYFLHKLMPLGDFKVINNTCVYPSGRTSDRVPFGTGKAMLAWIDEGKSQLTTYNFQSFEDLKRLIECMNAWYGIKSKKEYGQLLTTMPDTIVQFLEENDFYNQSMEIQKETASEEAFSKRFFNWLNGFKVLKFIHYCRDQHYPNATVNTTCKNLLDTQNVKYPDNCETEELLQIFRRLDGTA